MSPTRREHLAALAAIGGGDDELVATAVGADVDLEELVAEVPLVTSSGGGWVELHGLWTDHLGDVLDADTRRAIQQRAGTALLARGDRLRAFDLLAAAGAADEVAALVVETMGHAFLPVPPDALAPWVHVVGELLDGRPEAALLRSAVGREAVGSLTTAKALCEEAYDGFTARDDPDGQLAAIQHLFAIGYELDDAELLARTIDHAVRLEQAGHAPAGPIAAIGRSMVADYFGDHRGALDLLDAAPVADGDEWTAFRAWVRAELLESLGRPDASLEVIDACDYAGTGLIGLQLRASRVRALWSAGHVDEAITAGHRLMDGSSSIPSARSRQRGDVLFAQYFAHVGDAESADRHLAAADRLPPADRLIERRRRVSGAIRRLLDRDEAGAAEELSFLVGEGEVNQVLAVRRSLQSVLPVVYLLVPATRPIWDGAPLHGNLARWRDYARAMVAAREQGDLGPVAALGEIDVGEARAGLPLPLLVELAALLDGVGRPEGRELLAAAGAAGHGQLVALAEAGPVEGHARRLLGGVPRAPEEVVEVHLLGPPELRRDGEPSTDPRWRRDRLRQVLGFLVLHPSTTRGELAAAVWPDLEPEAAANNLRVTLSQLLGLLQPDRQRREPSYFVRAEGSALTLTGRDRLRVDVWELERHLDDAQRAEQSGSASAAYAAYRAALDEWRGPLAANAPWGWAELAAEALQSRVAGAAARAAGLALGMGAAGEAERFAELALTLDLWAEPAYRALASAQSERGDRSTAHRTLARCRESLDELGVTPEPATLMLERRLLRGVVEQAS
jgi:DNA-binding SARP family transcriptional activator